jgi:hypothetical protein
VLAIGAGDPRVVVGDADRGVVGGVLEADSDGRSGRGVLDGVRQHVVEDPFDLVRVDQGAAGV